MKTIFTISLKAVEKIFLYFTFMNSVIVKIHVFLLYRPINLLFFSFFEKYTMAPYLTPNRISYARVLLIFPCVFSFATHHYWLAVFFVLLNDMGDFLDGIVARAHQARGVFYNLRLGAFVDAICDKIFSVFVWYGFVILDFYKNGFSSLQFVVLLLGLIECFLFFKRINMFFSLDVEDAQLRASDIGKAKQTIEMIGTALLFVYPTAAGLILIFCIVLALQSLAEKYRITRKIS